jgi:hypothetical protein
LKKKKISTTGHAGALTDLVVLRNAGYSGVTPTFYKNENFCPHRSAYKNCISNYNTYEKLPKINLV